MNPNHERLLARLPAHSKTALIRQAVEATLAEHERYAAQRRALASSGEHTDVGVDKAVRANLPAAIRKMQIAKQPIVNLRHEIKSKHDALRPADPDKSNLFGAIQTMEIHQLSRSLKPLEREALMMTTTDVRLLEATVTSPPELSGFSANDRAVIDKIEARYIELKHPAEVAEIEALESLAAEAEAIAQVARNELRSVAGLSAQEFDSVARKVEAAVWLVGETGREQVCEPGPDGTATYRAATPDEVASGVRYADVNAYHAARAA
jgi:hypothetical protein